MLRISSQETADRVTLKLEGTLDGIWVSELLSAWRAAHPSLAHRNLYVDLTSVDRVDRAGEYLLVLIYRSGGRLVGSGVVLTELIQSIARDWPVERGGAGMIDIGNVIVIDQEEEGALLELMSEGGRFRCSCGLAKHALQHLTRGSRGNAGNPSGLTRPGTGEQKGQE